MNDMIHLPRSDKGEFWTEERLFITELHNSSVSPETSLALARVEVGVTTQLHSLTRTVERYVIRSGRGLIEVGGQSRQVGVGDQVVIPAGTPQRITNNGSEELIFYCLCTPRFMPGSYVNLEEEATSGIS